MQLMEEIYCKSYIGNQNLKYVNNSYNWMTTQISKEMCIAKKHIKRYSALLMIRGKFTMSHFIFIKIVIVNEVKILNAINKIGSNK